MMNKLKTNFIYNFILLFITFFSIEIISKLIIGSSIISYSTLRISLGLFIITFILSFILSFLSRKISKIIISILSLIFSIYACAQAGFHNFLGVYISFQTSSQLGAVTSYIKDFILSFKYYYYFTLIPSILLIIYFIFIDKKINISKSIYNVNKVVASIFMFGIICSMYAFTIILPVFQNSIQTVSNKDLFLTASNPSIAIDQYGILGFCVLDVKAMLFPVSVKQEYEIVQAEKKEVNDNSRIIDDTSWESLIEDEEDETLNSINNYLINRSITDKNEYTGLFEGKNLIVIMMESVNDIFINSEYYPNFYKILTNGWYFENNYSPRNSCATMNNEFSGMTSLYSIYNTCTASKYDDNTYYESIFNLFNNAGYVTFSAHDYTEAYYPRSKIHNNLGSGEYFGVQDLGITYSNEYINWANDDEFMEKVLDIIDEKTSNGENFMTWLTTVSSHQPYSVSSTQGDMYYSLTSGTGYSSDVRRYMSKLKILDNALGILLEGLESKGILDDTVIVLYGDHYPYGISTDHLNEVLEYDTSEDLNAERVPLVIYNSELESKTFSQYTSYINLLPTIANLFNLDYDPRLYLGTDLLSEDYESLVVFADGSWKNEFAYYDASKMKIKYYTDKTYTEDEIAAINKEVNNKISVSSDIIKNNYFSYLSESLEKYSSISENTDDDNICLLEEN